MAGGDFLIIWPAFIIENPDGNVHGHNLDGTGIAMSFYTDEDLAKNFTEGGGEWVLRQFDTAAQFHSYLLGLTGDFTHVAIDPTPNLVAKIIPIPHFIEALAEVI